MDVADRIISKHFAKKKDVSLSASPKNKVTFFHEVKLVLIPSKEEYRAAKLTNNLWFQDHEYASFKDEFSHEVRDFIQYHANNQNFMTTREAISMLYQPEDAQTSGNNFEPSSAISGTFSH